MENLEICFLKNCNAKFVVIIVVKLLHTTII